MRTVFLDTVGLIAKWDRGDQWHAAAVIDLVSFAIMRRLGIAEAFTNDKHFTAAGFTVLFSWIGRRVMRKSACGVARLAVPC